MSKKVLPKRVLLSFVGNNDPSNKSEENGPIVTLAGAMDFINYELLYINKPDSQRKAFETKKKLVKIHNNVSVNLHELPFTDPTDYFLLLPAMRKICGSLPKDNVKYYVSVASGTPAMHVCWFLLVAEQELSAKILYQRRPEYVEGEAKNSYSFVEIDPSDDIFPRVVPR